MSFRLAQRAAVATVRASARSTARSSRRWASTHAHEAKTGSDMPWIAGSGVVFGGALIYLLSPKGKKTVHHATEGEGNGLPASVVPPKSAEVHTETTPITKDDEGTEAPVEEVKESFKKAYSTDSPQDGEAAPTGSENADARTDDEGTTISKEEASESKSHQIVDSPKDAQAAEAKGAHFDSGAPGQDEQSHTDVEQKEKPSAQSGVGQIKEPSNVGEARQNATDGKAPADNEKQA